MNWYGCHFNVKMVKSYWVYPSKLQISNKKKSIFSKHNQTDRHLGYPYIQTRSDLENEMKTLARDRSTPTKSGRETFARIEMGVRSREREREK